MPNDLITDPSEKSDLTSWKEIATDLGLSVRAAQRLEIERGLPIKRNGNRVSISRAEMIAWKESNVKASAWWVNVRNLQRLLIGATIAICLQFIYVGVSLWLKLPGRIVSVKLEGKVASAMDIAGRAVWHYPFLQEIMPSGTFTPMSVVSDFESNGTLETVLSWPHIGRDSTGWGIYCISEKGKLLWDLLPKDHFRTLSGKEFGPPFILRWFTVLNSPEKDGTKWTAAIFIHPSTSFSTLIVVDSHGNRRGQYWHSGHLVAIKMFDADGDGQEDIVVGGVQHTVNQAVLLAFNPMHVGGSTLMPEGNLEGVVGPPGTEMRTLYFPRTKLNQETEQFNFVDTFELVNDQLQIQVQETIDGIPGYLLYRLGPGFIFRDLTISVSLESSYQHFKGKKELERVISTGELLKLGQQIKIVPGPRTR